MSRAATPAEQPTEASAETPAKESVTVALIGPSHNGKDGDTRTVSKRKARSLVDRGLARYLVPEAE